MENNILLMDKLFIRMKNLKATNNSKFNNLSNKDKKKIGIFARDFGMEHWDWPQGIGIFGLSNISNDYDKYIIEWAKKEISKGLPIANVNTVCPLLTLMNYKEFDELCLEWCEIVYNDFTRTSGGGIQHNTTGDTKYELTINEEQIWVDTIFMTVLFLGKMGVKYNNLLWIKESTNQLLLHIKYLFDHNSNLFYHGWDFKNNSNFGGNFWCRGNSWMTLALPYYCQYMSGHITTVDAEIINYTYTNQINSLLKLRDPETKLWHTILDDKTSYIEISGSAGILAGMYVGLKNKFIKNDLLENMLSESMESLISYIDNTGVVSSVSAGTAISDNKDDYKNIIKKPMVYGQAMCLLAINQFNEYGK